MSNRKKMPTNETVPQGQKLDVGGGGQDVHVIPLGDAIPKNARKGARQATSTKTPSNAVPAATVSAGLGGRESHINDASGGAVPSAIKPQLVRDSAKPIPRKGARRAKNGQPSNELVPDAKDAVLTANETREQRDGGGIDHVALENHSQAVDPATVAAKPTLTREDYRKHIRDRENAVHRRAQELLGRGGFITPPKIEDGVIAAIQSLHREHRALQRARGDMDRRIKADERWFAVRRLRAAGEPLPPGKFPETTKADAAMVIATRQRFFTIRDVIETERKACQKELLKLVKPLPVMAWVGTVKGLGLPSVAAIIGEAGDLAAYSNPGKLWKRMGLAVIDGKGQGKRNNAEEALRHGYSPARRSEMHVVGDCLVRAGGPYADLYRERKAYEAERDGITKMHAHKRALRYIEKRLLRQMWQAWRGAIVEMETEGLLPSVILNLRKFTQEEIDAMAGHNGNDSHPQVASQDGCPPINGTPNDRASVPSIPRKRALPRANEGSKSVFDTPEAAD